MTKHKEGLFKTSEQCEWPIRYDFYYVDSRDKTELVEKSAYDAVVAERDYLKLVMQADKIEKEMNKIWSLNDQQLAAILGAGDDKP